MTEEGGRGEVERELVSIVQIKVPVVLKEREYLCPSVIAQERGEVLEGTQGQGES